MRQEILRLLRKAGNHYVSGEEIAETLGVSRTAVWKHIKELRRVGYDIVSQAHSGYRLEGAPDLLTPAELAPLLKTKVIGAISCIDPIQRSNDALNCCCIKIISNNLQCINELVNIIKIDCDLNLCLSINNVWIYRESSFLVTFSFVCTLSNFQAISNCVELA